MPTIPRRFTLPLLWMRQVTAVFCSTVPAFGFSPLRPNGRVVEIKERLYCRPCGLHGHKACPEGHFRCAKDITYDQLL